MNIKSLGIVILLLIVVFASGQEKDRRAVFRPDGLHNLSVSPNGKIWMIARANLFYKNKSDTSWHLAPTYFPDSLGPYSYDDLLQLSFFNKDTALLTGRIKTGESRRTSGYYLTFDGGKHWQPYGLASQRAVEIRSVVTDACGHAWMTDVDGTVYFSDNFGKQFQKISLPFERTFCSTLFMTTAEKGIAGGWQNELIITRNNWQSASNIDTPFDQVKFMLEGQTTNDQKKIFKIRRFKNYWVVNQGGHVFYSDTSTINWKYFDKPLMDFETDAKSEKLVGVSDSLFIFSFNSPVDFIKASDQRLNAPVLNMRLAEPDLYVLTLMPGEYKAKAFVLRGKEIIQSGFYTHDQKIETPRMLLKAKQWRWGAEGKELYREDEQGWFRETTLGFEISSIYLLNDSNVVIWDGVQNNYLYSLKDQTISEYRYKNPLRKFISAPVQSMDIYLNMRTSSSRGYLNIIAYDRTRRGRLTTGTNMIYTGKFRKRRRLRYKNTIRRQSVDTVIAHVNGNVYRQPSIKDFRISKQDKQRFFQKIEKQYGDGPYLNEKDQVRKLFYLAAPPMLDTLNLSSLIKLSDRGPFFTRNMQAYLVNANGDTLSIRQLDYLNWELVYNKQSFVAYSLELADFIRACLPRRFQNKKFKGRFALEQLVNRMYYKKDKNLD